MPINSLLQQDRDHVIHPLVPLRYHERRGATVLASASGCFVRHVEGHDLLDGFAGPWCVNAGYGQESLVAAATEQMRRLPYATQYFHYGSEPPIRLAARLADLAPAPSSTSSSRSAAPTRSTRSFASSATIRTPWVNPNARTSSPSSGASMAPARRARD